MSESTIKIALSDNLYVYGTLRGSYTDPLIILCHGYGGWRHEMLMYNSARYFEKEGYSTLRLSMYAGGDNSRDIVDSDVMTHADDLDVVVEYARKAGAKWIGVAGHSFSGMAIIYSKKQIFDAAALWDPTHTDAYEEPEAKKSLDESFLYVEKLKAYVSGQGTGYVYAKTVLDNNYPTSRDMAQDFKVPTVVINASWSKQQQEYGKEYVNYISALSTQVIIPESTHPFTEDGAADKLFAATAKFFKEL